MLRRLSITLLLILLLWVAALFSYVGLIQRLDGQGKNNLSTQTASSIIVLTGGGHRIALGRDLLLEGAAPKMFISGVGDGVRLQDILPDLPEHMKSKVYLGNNADDTYGNAREVEQWLAQQNNKKDAPVILITAHYHLPRALWHVKSRMPEVRWISIAAQPEDLPLDRWYTNLLGWRLLSTELIKYIAQMVQQ